MKITAVVVTHNRLNLLKKSIDCLHLNKDISNILIINNGSTDGTREWLNSQQGLDVIHQDNVGGSGGFYTGIKKAYEDGADWIWCMDDDVFPRQDCLEKLLYHINTENIGIIMPRRYMGGKIFTHEFCKYNFENPFTSMKKEKLANKNISHVIEIVGADFEGPFIKRDIVETVGLPNKDFFIFCDDTEYCLRAHLAGFKLLYVPDAILDKHEFFVGDSWSDRNKKKKWKRYYHIRNTSFLNHTYGKNWGVKYLRSGINLMGYVIPAIFSMPFTKAWKWNDIKNLFKAYSDGINHHLGKI